MHIAFAAALEDSGKTRAEEVMVLHSSAKTRKCVEVHRREMALSPLVSLRGGHSDSPATTGRPAGTWWLPLRVPGGEGCACILRLSLLHATLTTVGRILSGWTPTIVLCYTTVLTTLL